MIPYSIYHKITETVACIITLGNWKGHQTRTLAVASITNRTALQDKGEDHSFWYQ